MPKQFLLLIILLYLIFLKMSRVGKLFLILGPSGSGKGTLIEALKKKYPKYIYPISVTSRERREKEKEGDVYHFVGKKEFKKMLANGDFLEWAVVHQNNYYGTLKKPILNNLKLGKVVIRELDIQGFESVRKILHRNEFISIFIKPDSIENLIARIKKRSKMSKQEIKRRIESAKNEIAKSKECDYIIHNSDGKLAEALEETVKIIEKEVSSPIKNL